MHDLAAVARLLVDAGHAHHQAFIDTDGFDPEWPLWYAEHLIAPLRALGYAGSQSEVVATLVEAERGYREEAAEAPWPQFYAERFESD